MGRDRKWSSHARFLPMQLYQMQAAVILHGSNQTKRNLHGKHLALLIHQSNNQAVTLTSITQELCRALRCTHACTHAHLTKPRNHIRTPNRHQLQSQLGIPQCQRKESPTICIHKSQRHTTNKNFSGRFLSVSMQSSSGLCRHSGNSHWHKQTLRTESVQSSTTIHLKSQHIQLRLLS